MSELELLYIILLVIYGCECLLWLPRGSVGFVTWLGRRWRLASPSTLLGNQRGGLVAAPPLPPLGTVLAGVQFPLSLCPESVLAHVSGTVNPAGRPAQTGRLFAFAEIARVRCSGKKVFVDKELLFKAASASLAARITRQLRELATMNPRAREDAIKKIVAHSFDKAAVERRWQDFNKAAAPLRLMSNLVFCYLFILAPALIWRFGFRSLWPWLLAAVVGLMIGAAVFYLRLHKQLYPALNDERFTNFLLVLLAPSSTIRARDSLSRPLLEEFHPLAVAAVFAGKEEFAQLAAWVLRDLRHPALPICPNEAPAATAAETYWRSLLCREVEAFLSRAGLNPGQFLQPPAPADDTCKSYCPRCQAQFTQSATSCADCGGMPLVGLQTAS
jgi:hypothetical protein